MSFLTCRCDFPQKEHSSCSLESVGRAILSLPCAPSCFPDLVLRDHAIDYAVLRGLLGGHEVIALGIGANLLVGLPGVIGNDSIQALAYIDDLLGVDLDVSGLTLEARTDLVDEDLGVGQRHALALRAARQQEGAHAHRDADADGLDVGLDELHGVVDREAGVDAAARRVDVDRDVLVGILGLEVQELRHDQVGDLIVDRGPKEDDALIEQAGVDVERALAAGRLLNHHWDKGAHGSRFGSLSGRPVLPAVERASLLIVGFWPEGLERYEPGVRRWPAPLSSPSLPGVQSLSRAWACSTLTGLARSTSQSTARRWARSCLSSSIRPAWSR